LQRRPATHLPRRLVAGVAVAYVNLMEPITIFTGLAMAIVVAVLIAGLINLYRPGDKARSRSNQLMRLRVLAQFIAVVLLMFGLWLKTRSA
jgi:uncharacterized membrane protein YraQ (UPF0718 family)